MQLRHVEERACLLVVGHNDDDVRPLLLSLGGTRLGERGHAEERRKQDSKRDERRKRSASLIMFDSLHRHVTAQRSRLHDGGLTPQ